MIALTNIAGLAGCAVAVAAVAVKLPGVARLQPPYLALLACAIAVVVLIPFGGLPLAAYVRGVTGDLSITTLVLLLVSILCPLCANAPGGKPDLLCKAEDGRTASLLLVAMAAAGLYPLALGLGYFDPYRLGFGDLRLLAALLVLALAAFRRWPLVAMVIALAVLAWAAGWYESANLWDYLLDPMLALYALAALLRRSVRGVVRGRKRVA